MALVDKTISGQYNGVSQQIYNLRNDTQCEKQKNVINSLTDGVYKRHKSEFVKKIYDYNNKTNNFYHFIDRDETEKYFIEINDESEIKVYNPEGVEYTVLNYDYNGYNILEDYLNTTTPNKSLRAVTINDTTILLNREKTIGYGETTTDNTEEVAFVYVSNGISSQDYSVTVGTTTVTITTADSSNFEAYKTTTIASDLTAQLNTVSGFVAEQDGSLIKIYRTDGNPFSFSVSDSWGDQAMIGIYKTIDAEISLPPNFEENQILEVTGRTNTKADNYYVKYSDGSWREYRKPNSIHSIDNKTLPVRLLRFQDVIYVTEDNPYGIYFQLDLIPYNDREVGDDNTCPFPSFMGNNIENILFFENRLCFLSQDNIIFSRSGDLYNLFPTTATEILDDDPIDITVNSADSSKLLYGLPFHNNMVLFSSKRQFVVSSNQGVLTPKSINVDVTTNFSVETLSKPLTLGSNLYFIDNKGVYSKVREYYVQQDTITNDASDITSHVPNYVKKNILKIVGTTSSDMVFILSNEDRKTLYNYKYYWNGNEKVQSAWNKWTFDSDILNIEIIDNKIYLLQENEGEVVLNVINLEKEQYNNTNFDIHLDMVTNLTFDNYNSNLNQSTFTLPYKIKDIETLKSLFFIVDYNGFEKNNLTVLEVNDNEIIFKGDLSSYENSLTIGKRFNMIHQFSRFSVKSPNTNVSDIEGRIQLSKVSISYNNSVFFSLKVKPKGRNVTEKLFTNVKVGSSIFGKIEASEGIFKSYVRTNSDNEGIWLENDTAYPSGFQTLSWEGQYTKRSRGI